MTEHSENKLTEWQIERLARGIRYESLAEFYSHPENVAAFEAWKKERDEKQHD